MAAAEQVPEPLKYQTLSLKVSIHCEGCKRKVKKVLQNIEGVYMISIEPQQHKVVVTGNVEAETLIKRLLKNGKQAELWPEKKPESNNNGNSSSGNKKKNKNKNNNNKANEVSEQKPNSETNQSSASEENSSNEVSEQKPDPENARTPTKDSSPPPEKQEVVVNPVAPQSAGSGSGGKKKKKKGNNNKNGGGNGNGNCGAETETIPQHEADVVKKVAGESVVIPPSYNFPAAYSNNNLPSYVVSYNSAQPSMSYGGAYCMASPLQPSSSYVQSATPGSYYIFSEENANACMIM